MIKDDRNYLFRYDGTVSATGGEKPPEYEYNEDGTISRVDMWRLVRNEDGTLSIREIISNDK